MSGHKLTNLRARRVAASLPPLELARRANVSLRAVLAAEQQAANPGGSPGGVIGSEEAARIAAVLATTIADLKG